MPSKNESTRAATKNGELSKPSECAWGKRVQEHLLIHSLHLKGTWAHIISCGKGISRLFLDPQQILVGFHSCPLIPVLPFGHRVANLQVKTVDLGL